MRAKLRRAPAMPFLCSFAPFFASLNHGQGLISQLFGNY